MGSDCHRGIGPVALHCRRNKRVKRFTDGRTNVGDSGHETRDFLLPEAAFSWTRAANKRYRRLYREIRLDSRLPPVYTPFDSSRSIVGILNFLHRSADYAADSTGGSRLNRTRLSPCPQFDPFKPPLSRHSSAPMAGEHTRP